MVTRIRHGYYVAAAMTMMLQRAILVMLRIAGFPVIVMVRRVLVRGGNDITGILRKDTRLKPGANAEHHQTCEQPFHERRHH
jgi:hypothetical protein